MKILVTVILSAGLLLAALLGGVVSESRSAGPAPVDQTQAAALRSEFGSADTVSLVRRLQDQARARPDDAQTNALLGLAYAQRARETGDAAFYSRADAVLRRAHELDARERLRPDRPGRDRARAASLRRRASDRTRRAGGGAGLRSAVRRRRRRAARARPLPRGVRDLRPHGRAEAERVLVLPRLLRPRAARRRRRRDRGDGAGARRVDRPARGHGVDRRRARQAALVGRARSRRAPRTTALRFRSCPATSRRSTRSPASRRHAGTRPARSRSSAVRSSRSRCRATSRSSATCSPAPAGRPRRRSSTRSSARSSGCRWRTGSRSTSRPRSTASTTGSGCATRSRSRGSAQAERPSIHGDDVLAWALARNGRCAEALVHSKRSLRLGTRDATFFFHRGDDRALPRPARRGPQLVRARRRAEPALLHSLGTHRTGGTQMKRLLVLAGCLAALLAPAAAQAHPLGNFTINRHTAIELSGGRIYVQYALDLAEIPTLQEGKRVRAAGFAAEAGPRARAPGRRQARAAPRPRAPHGRAAGCGRPEDAPLRRRLRDRGDRVEADVPRPQLRLADRLEGSGRALERRRRAAHRQRSRHEPEQRAPRLPPGPAPLAARRHDGDCRVRPRRGRGHAAVARRRHGGRASRRRLRGADLARRPLARRDPALAGDRGLLGCGPRAHARARQGDRRRLPRRHEGPAASTRCCSAGS